jgi:WD40 repeat protein/serine/threonine protein kinase
MALDAAETNVHHASYVFSAQASGVGGKDLTLSPDDPAPHPQNRTPQPPDSAPSFSSLVGQPTQDSDGSGVDAGDVVPFGDLGAEFMPPEVPGYEILEEVGRGGMGVVYRARQLSLNRPVALKMILAGSHAGAAERERFRREAESVAALQNQHIVQIFEIGEAHGHLYLALEYVEGGSLAQHVARTTWPVREAAELVELLARAVQFAHHRGIVHRDLKPGNILLAGARPRTGRVLSHDAAKDNAAVAPAKLIPKITDFGLAKRLNDSANPDGTKSGAVMGTPGYIAPEQASGKARDVGPAADVYALGAILYELLTGRPPFTGETALETVLQVLNDDPVPPKRLKPGIPRDLETICLKCLDKVPAKRYASADALAEDLHRFLTGEPIKARPLTAWGRAVKWARRHPSLAMLGTITVAATIALVSGLSVAYARVRDAVEQKENEAKIASLARMKEAAERNRAEELAEENDRRRAEAVVRNDELKREANRTRRAAFALQLAQVAAMCERDPHRALILLNDETRCPLDLRDFTWAYLHRLCNREERVYLGHPPNDPLHAVAYSPTGALVATAGEAGDVRVWDARTGRTWLVLVGNAARVRGVAFSPDGRVIATASADRSVRLWQLPTDVLSLASKTLDVLTFLQPVVKPVWMSATVNLEDAHASEVNCVAFSPDGRFLVSGGEDGLLRWWDVWGWHANVYDAAIAGPAAALSASWTHSRRAAAARAVWQGRPAVVAHDKAVLSLVFDAAGSALVTGGADRMVKVWTPDSSDPVRVFPEFGEVVPAVAITPDGKQVAAVSNGDVPAVRLFSVASGKEVRRLIGHTQPIFALAISEDGELLASAGKDRTLRIWGIEDGLERGQLLGHEQQVNGLAFSPDRRTVVSAGLDSTARVWQTTVRPYEVVDVAEEITPRVATVSKSGNLFVVGDEAGQLEVNRADVYPLRLGNGANKLPFRLASVPIASLKEGRVEAVAATPDGRIILASNRVAVYVWQNMLSPGHYALPPSTSPRPPVGLRVPLPVYGMAVSPDGRVLATLDGEGLRLWNLDAVAGSMEQPDQLVAPVGPGLIARVTDAKDLAFDGSGTRIAVAVGTGIRIFDRSGNVLADLPAAHATKLVTLIFGGRDSEWLASADERGLVKVWRTTPVGGLELQAELASHSGPVESLSFSPDGRTLASGGLDRTVLLWDPVTGQERAALTGNTDRILYLHFLPDSSALITIGHDGTARRWRAEHVSGSTGGIAQHVAVAEGDGPTSQ